MCNWNQIFQYVCCSKIQVNNNKVEAHIFEWSQFWDKIEMCDIYTLRGETWGNMSITRTQSSETLSPNMSWRREQKGDLCKLQLAASGWARQHVSANCWATVPGWRVIIPDTTTDAVLTTRRRKVIQNRGHLRLCSSEINILHIDLIMQWFNIFHYFIFISNI